MCEQVDTHQCKVFDSAKKARTTKQQQPLVKSCLR